MIFWDDRERQIDGKGAEQPEEPRYDEVLGSTCIRSDFYFVGDDFSYNIVRTRAEVPDDEDYVEVYTEYDRISETSTIHLFFYNECGNLISEPYPFELAAPSEPPISFTSEGKRQLKAILDNFFFEHIVPLAPAEEDEVTDDVE
jgi:hypothetical protein